MKIRTALPLLLLLIPYMAFAQPVELYDLRCENLREPLSIDNISPRFSWKIETPVKGFAQSAYQIMVYSKPTGSGEHLFWDSGKVSSARSVLVPYGGAELPQSSVLYWKVRIWDGKGRLHPWSEENRFGVGLLSWDDWTGDYIGMPDPEDGMISPKLRKEFTVTKTGEPYLLHVNSLGYHEVYINGERVGDAVLSPAVSELRVRSLSNTYDITDYLADGRNTIVIWLGQGWYKKHLNVGAVHNGPLVRAEVKKFDGHRSHTVLTTDATWQAADPGLRSLGNWLPHQFGGEYLDARVDQRELDWGPVTVYDVPRHAVSPQMCEPNVIYERFPAREVFRDGDGNWIVDMGTTYTGWASIELPHQKAGTEVRFEYADHYDDPDDFSLELGHYDILVTTAGSGDTFRNRFNYHSFRYIRILGLEGGQAPRNITGYAIRTGFDDHSRFDCSDADMNAIHDMVKRTFEALSLGGYLVDCHHIERLGYGGDGNASAQAAQTMWGMAGLYNNWMQAWADSMRPGGSMPHTAPNPLGGGGGPYWCAFMVAGPWRTYVNYGDMGHLERYYPYMEEFMGYLESYVCDNLLTRWPDTDYRGWFLGDWACPDGINAMEEESVMLIASCVALECYDIMERASLVLDKEAEAGRYRESRVKMEEAVHGKFYDPKTRTYGSGTQADMASALLSGAVPDSLVRAVNERLLDDILTKWDGHLKAGLYGVTKVTEWATRYGEVDAMYDMLKKREYPGYLYMIDNGATTTWEYWQGLRSRIHNCYNGIGSWFYQALGGIGNDHLEPGFRHVIISPQIPRGIDWVNTEQRTPYGQVVVNWKKTGKGLEMDITVPVGSYATVVIPDGYQSARIDGRKVKVDGGRVGVESGRYRVRFN